jgi:hypothetical protein
MTGRYVRVFFTLLLVLVAASPSFAARRSSLSGNLLIQDTDDMFFFPQLVAQQKRLVTFDFGTTDGLGSGGMVFGTESFAFGVFAHRSEFLGALPDGYLTRGDIDNITRAGAIDRGIGPNALNWIDVLAGWQAGDMPIGVRFSVGRGNDDPAEAAPTDPDVQQNINAFNVIVGARFPQWGATDASLEFSYANAEQNDATLTRDSSPWEISVGLRHTANEESDALVLGWLGMFNYGSGTVDVTPVGGGPGTSTDDTKLNVVVGAGPVYKPSDRTNVAMYGTFEYAQTKTETGTTTETHTNTVIPGWNVAAELEAASWLQFRAGLRSKFNFFDDHHEATGVDTHDKNNSLDYAWTTGVGIHLANFTVDGFLDPSVITSGTDVFGNSDNLFGLVTASYHF